MDRVRRGALSRVSTRPVRGQRGRRDSGAGLLSEERTAELSLNHGHCATLQDCGQTSADSVASNAEMPLLTGLEAEGLRLSGRVPLPCSPSPCWRPRCSLTFCKSAAFSRIAFLSRFTPGEARPGFPRPPWNSRLNTQVRPCQVLPAKCGVHVG